ADPPRPDRRGLYRPARPTHRLPGRREPDELRLSRRPPAPVGLGELPPLRRRPLHPLRSRLCHARHPLLPRAPRVGRARVPLLAGPARHHDPPPPRELVPPRPRRPGTDAVVNLRSGRGPTGWVRRRMTGCPPRRGARAPRAETTVA